MKKVLSFVQPTGELHLGNYFGAVQNWVRLQTDYQCVYGVANFHSMTMPYKASNLRENTWNMAFQLLACEIKIENLLIQSLVPEHAELCWVLSNVASYGELLKMTQFKDKKSQLEDVDNQSLISTGLFMYPILQAADILMYRADYVPVGKDQEQHLELSRNIAARFNHQFEQEYFVHPEPLFTVIPKLLSPADPTKKMSKSLGEKHYISLFSDESRLRKQIKSAVTDTGETLEAGAMSAGVGNLFTLLKACGKHEVHDALMEHYTAGTLRYSDLKGEVADALVEFTRPFGERLAAIQADKKTVKQQLQDSAATIRKTAQQTMREVREITGLLTVKS